MLKLRQNKSLIIVVVVVLLLLALRLTSAIVSRSSGSVDPHINLRENVTSQIIERQRQQQISAFISVTEGETSRTEERIREATGLSLATSLYLSSESMSSRFPVSVESLLSGIKSTRLMPPEMEILGSGGVVISRHSRLALRYRLEPLAVEVLSLGKVHLDGPALLIRVGGNDSGDVRQQGAQLFIATSLDLNSLPPPFASDAEIIALGFAPEPFRAAKLPQGKQ